MWRMENVEKQFRVLEESVSKVDRLNDFGVFVFSVVVVISSCQNTYIEHTSTKRF